MSKHKQMKARVLALLRHGQSEHARAMKGVSASKYWIEVEDFVSLQSSLRTAAMESMKWSQTLDAAADLLA